MIPRIDFDAALYTLSDCLVEARIARERGHGGRASALFTAAERYALRSGYLELLRLVWAYDDRPKTSAGSSTAVRRRRRSGFPRRNRSLSD